MRIARLALITAFALVASPLIAGDVSQGAIQGKVDCGKHCDKVMVYLEDVDGSFTGEGVTRDFDQKGKVFLPHILPIVKGTTVRMKNSDPFLHNVHAYAGKRGLFNLGMPPNSRVIERTFEESGNHTILCDVHPEMAAYIVVLDNPFFSTVEPDGTFEIGDVPLGSHTVVLYHPARKKQMKQVVEVEGQPVQVEFLSGKKGK